MRKAKKVTHMVVGATGGGRLAFFGGAVKFSRNHSMMVLGSCNLRANIRKMLMPKDDITHRAAKPRNALTTKRSRTSPTQHTHALHVYNTANLQQNEDWSCPRLSHAGVVVTKKHLQGYIFVKVERIW